MMPPKTTAFCAERLGRIKPRMQSYVDEGKLPGISTMITHENKIIHFEQVGYADIEAKKPLAADAIFRLYSMTKPIVAVALMMLFEEGKFMLFDPVDKFIPAFKDLKVLAATPTDQLKQTNLQRPITIRDLLTHTAGLTYDFLDDSPIAQLYREAQILRNADKSLEEMVHTLAQFPLAYQPGARWHYSLSIDVIGHLVEIISGQPLNHFLKERIFNPLDMSDTDFYVPDDKLDRLVAIYGAADIAGQDVTLNQMIKRWEMGAKTRIDVSQSYPTSKPESFRRGGIGLFSTAQDYMRFAQMLLNHGKLNDAWILSRKTIDLMFMNHLSAEQMPLSVGELPLPGYGFGLGSRVCTNVAETQVPGSLGEFGWGGAAKTYYWVDPVEKIVGLFMSQELANFDMPEKDFQVLTYQALSK